MVCLFALGIPGGACTAVLLPAFSGHNVTGVPRFMAEQADVIYAIILANIGQAILLLFVGLALLPLLATIVRVPRSILGPSVLVVATFGCFGITGDRSEEHTSELQSLMRISYAVLCLKKKNKNIQSATHIYN